MVLQVISIGNSKGIILYKSLLKRYNITDTVELVFERDHIVIKPKIEPRKGWAKSFKKMNERGEDKLLIADVFADENLEE